MNKPVAWMGLTAHNQNRVSIEKLANDDIPLYTHPTELTDEEIWELHQEHIDEVTCGHSMKTVGFIEFARAILRKASEK